MRTHKPRTDPKGLDNPRDIEGVRNPDKRWRLGSGGAGAWGGEMGARFLPPDASHAAVDIMISHFDTARFCDSYG